MYQWIKRKIENGRFRELWRECLWVWQYTWRYKGTVLIHLLLGILGIVMSLGSSVASKFLIDAVISFDSGMIGTAAALMIGMRLGNIAMKSIATRIAAMLDIRIQNEIQAEIYQRILRTDWESLEDFRSGDLLNRISSDANTVSGGVIGFVPSLICNGVQLLGAFLIILHYDPTMALIALVGTPLTILFSTVLMRKMRHHNKELKAVYSDVMSFQQESFQNITTIKAFGVMDWFGTRMRKEQQGYKEKYLDYSKFSVWTSALMNLLSLFAYIGCFGWGVYRLWLGRITYGEMTMFLQLSGMLGAAFSAIVGLVPNAISITTSAGRVMAVVELPEEKTQADLGFEQESSFTMELKHVNFHYAAGAPVLKQVDMAARPGELISLTGPSGEGKTTLLRVMLGLIHPSEGSASLIGGSGREYPLCAATREVFGYVPQGNQVFNGTIAENLKLSNPNATEEEMLEALKIACAYDFVMALPGGLNHVVGGRDKRLSEGQAQRLAVARALLKKAPILLLDEATSALDMDTETALLKNLMDSGLVKTCILVTHRPAGKDLCSRRYHIRDGVVQEVV